MSDIKEWARERWTKAYNSTNQTEAIDMGMAIAQEAYERGVNQSRFGMHLPPVVATVPGIVPLASRPASLMTIRERFAMAAMHAQICSPQIVDVSSGAVAKYALVYADALIAALEAKP